MRGLTKYLCLLLFVLLIIPDLYSQNSSTGNSFNKIILIDKDTLLSNKEKLRLLYSLEQTAKENKKTFDSGYIINLVKIAKYEYLADTNTAFAIDYSLKALQTNKELHHPCSKNIIINCCFNLAVYYNMTMQQNKALAYFDTVISLCKQSALEGDYLLESRLRKSDIYTSVCDYQKVVDETTLGINEALSYNDTSNYVKLLNIRSYALVYQNNLALALADLDKAIRFEQNTNSNYWLITSYENKALAYKQLNRNSEAEQLFKQAIQLCPKDSNIYYERIAINYNNLGEFYLYNLNYTAEAKTNYLKTLEYANLCPFSVKALVSLIAYTNLCVACKNEKNYTEATAFYTKAFEQINFTTKNILLNNPTLQQLSLFEYKDPIFALLANKTEFLLRLYKENSKIY